MDRNDLTILCSTVHDDELMYSHEIHDTDLCLIFYKVHQTTSNEFKLGMCTMEGSRANALYNSLSLIYLPNGNVSYQNFNEMEN